MTVGASMEEVLAHNLEGAERSGSENEDQQEVGQDKDAEFQSIPIDAGRHTEKKKTELKERRTQRNKHAQEIDAMLETTAEEQGRLNLRTIEELTLAAGGEGLLKKGHRFLCRQEVLVRIAEDSEHQQRMYSTHTAKKGGAKDGQTKTRGQYQARVVVSVCADDEECEYITRAAFAWDEECGAAEDAQFEPWEIMEYHKHTCGREDQAGALKGAGARKEKAKSVPAAGKKIDKKKKKKTKTGKKGRGAPGWFRKTAYSTDMLARAVTPAVISTGRYSKAQVKEVVRTLQKHVRMQVTKTQAVRARDRCMEMWHGTAATGASRVRSIGAQLAEKGYWVRMHQADEKQMVEMTVRGMHSQHEAIQRGLRKSDRVQFDLATVHAEVKAFFGNTAAQGKKYLAGVSFCNPAARDVIRKRNVHLVSFTDSCHGHSPALGHITQTNVLDAGRKVVPALTSIFSFNESKASQVLHYVALGDCHSELDRGDEAQPAESVMNTAEHHMIMDCAQGGIQASNLALPDARKFLCSRHMKENVVERAGGSKAGVLYYKGLKCNTVQQLTKVVTEEFTDKLRSYVEQQKAKAPNLHVFPAEVELRGNTTGNVVEGTHAADASARKLAMDRAMEEYSTLHGSRYYMNRAEAHSCDHKAPPKVQAKMEDVILRAAALKGDVTIQDQANPARGARVPTLKNTFVTSDLSGDRMLKDVECTCGSPSTNGFPCIHNVKHAQLIGIDPYDLLHYKDTTAAWRDQYDEEFVFPTLSSEEIVPNDSDKDFMYPPVPPPKVGRPKKGGRIKGSKEKALKRKHSLPICSKCGNAGHISSNKQCPERTGKRKR